MVLPRLTTQPRLSVLIANYNHARFLRKCFAGYEAQTFADFEIIITDDGSTDGSQEIIREYACRDPRFKPEFFPKNRGLAAACENLFSRGTGDYFYSGAADDFVINKDFFQRAIAALDGDLRPAGFYGINGIIQAETDKLVMSCGTAEVEGYNTPLQCTEGFLKCRSVITGPSCIWRRALFLKYWGTERNGELFNHLGSLIDFYVSHALAFTHGMYYEKLPFACQRVFQAKTNYSAITNLWKIAEQYAQLERLLRVHSQIYPTIEKDWLRWRAFWLQDSINKSGDLSAA